MPAIKAAAWPQPLDNVFTPTSDDQVDTEEAINALFYRIRPSRFDFAKDVNKKVPVINTWLSEAEQAQQSEEVSAGDKATPRPGLLLERQAHVNFLTKLLEPLPGAYTAFDTNRSWLLYWILQSYDLLSVSLDPKGRARAIATLLSFQNTATGGFGGGPNQISHLMATYAAVSALAIIGGPGSAPTAEDIANAKSVEVGRGGWDDIDREKMYEWISSLKQPDGSFLVHTNGEVDVRAGYCVVCIATLLGISTKGLFDGMAPFVASCQTYEGGIAAASQPTYKKGSSADDGITLISDDVPRPTLGEAHGGYTYCAAASHLALSLLESSLGGSTSSSSATPTATSFSLSSSAILNRDALIRWATAQQGIPFEGCGFRGRTNKLVDGCYGWFSGGGLFTVLSAMVEADLIEQAAHVGKLAGAQDWNGMLTVPPVPTIFAPLTDSASSGSWKTESTLDPADGSDDEADDLSPLTLFDRVGLQEYILVAAQRTASEGGGLRDKPGKRPDAYHTCYNLCGLSLSQHSVRLSTDTSKYLYQNYKGKDEWSKKVYATMLAWTLSTRDEIVIEARPGIEGTQSNKLNPTHPIFNITFPKAKAFMDWAYGQ
ncbi:related to RAM1 - protein farnesyltransferase, beta subunit [Melanopsichium pennsylvanicum]|uniref:Protein farnesyltransferase subunit beta n=2 Tax=Melanopsichium pennsylvanicum TaxID=63383 RepID=A0AAJ4XRB6_9BASI|nr:related to RAM1-protein farnesyltransferase, beta subunit [Melanopsichium pennsylvanicum 4]SNX87425.1 related to RAM1 - protein farnesyltransferase, beta subunit [Melanopsichium pennsylvanicum]